MSNNNLNIYELIDQIIEQALPAEDFFYKQVLKCHSDLVVTKMVVFKFSQKGRYTLYGSTYSQVYIEAFLDQNQYILWIGEIRFVDDLTDALFVLQYPVHMSSIFGKVDEEESDDDDYEEA